MQAFGAICVMLGSKGQEWRRTQMPSAFYSQHSTNRKPNKIDSSVSTISLKTSIYSPRLASQPITEYPSSW
ncbi:hypothetical protein SeMB42_g02078 [Synchytrium endobioticum]|uniref:Uncharacterized protein n=1 Tax=Synchytrium endobioticum TaxID=286115 RepID=A0A507CTR7_9FUNG|nr:hypothetical protein SeLEV6574_g07913 [Synchytrium endobioticum]TPX42526.1 hypothetical protein SeLEV6574_g05554 [Synchytrium endobioticum]TPX50956.1 hypothetical protein SeMB42_g02078 [Synchytrium endobioticum]